MEFLYSYVPLLLCIGLITIPFGMLYKESYKAIKKTNSVPAGSAVSGYIPFVSYCSTYKLFYGNITLPAVWTVCSLGCIVFRLVCYFMHINGSLDDPRLMLISVWVSIAGIGLWYLLMAYIAFDTARLTRRGIVTKLLAIILPFIGAYLVSKNVRRYFAELNKEANDDFAGRPVRNNNKA